jgi:hypothetical protein
MRDSSPSPRPSSPRPGSPRLSFMLVLAILAMIVVPAALTLHTVHLSALNPATATTPGASPYGYTVSLLLFIVPILVIAFWFVPQESVKIEKKSFLWTIGLLFPIEQVWTSSSHDTSSPSLTRMRPSESKHPL